MPFGSEEVIHRAVWERIKTYTEEDHDKQNLARIHALFRYADRIVFLGMSYHERNMKLLFQAGGPKPNCQVWGTAADLPRQKLKRARAYFDDPVRRAPQLEPLKCGPFLEQFGSGILAGF